MKWLPFVAGMLIFLFLLYMGLWDLVWGGLARLAMGR